MLDKFCGSYGIHISISFHLSEQFSVVKKKKKKRKKKKLKQHRSSEMQSMTQNIVLLSCAVRQPLSRLNIIV